MKNSEIKTGRTVLRFGVDYVIKNIEDISGVIQGFIRGVEY
ncbi:MAG: hypothetical protein ACUZ8E_18190 [Candidatus Anammoxibacter sp.]